MVQIQEQAVLELGHQQNQFQQITLDNTNIIVMTQQNTNSIEENILIQTLFLFNIQYQKREYKQRKTGFGQLPHLSLKSQIYNKSEIIKKLSELTYDSKDERKVLKQKTFVLEFSNNMNRIINYYLNYQTINTNLIQQQQIQELAIQQFSLLTNILEKYQRFQFLEKQSQFVMFADIVVYYYIKGILETIPKSYPDYLLRSYYCKLTLWYFNIEAKIKIKSNLQKTIKIKQKNDNQEIQPIVKLNLNFKKSFIGLAILTTIYCIFD